MQLQNTRQAISRLFTTLLDDTRGFIFIETLVVKFVTKIGGEYEISKPEFNSKAQIVINSNDFMETLQLSQQQILNTIAIWVSEGSGWIISSIVEHYVNNVMYRPIMGSSHIPLPTELQRHNKGLINLINNDNECFRWCNIRYLNPKDNNLK